MRHIHHPTLITSVPVVAGIIAIAAHGCAQKSTAKAQKLKDTAKADWKAKVAE